MENNLIEKEVARNLKDIGDDLNDKYKLDNEDHQIYNLVARILVFGVIGLLTVKKISDYV